MKIFKFLAIALVAMLGFTACDKDCDHEFIEYDYNEALTGTWTCLEEGQAEAMVINPDGSFEVTGVMKGGSGSLYESKGTIKVVNNKVSLVFEGDKDVIEGRLEFVAGKSLSIVLNEENDIRLTYNYCENDLSDEIIGMWVSFGNSSNEENNMFIQTFNENGKSTYTGFGEIAGEIVVKKESNYKVIGDACFHEVNGEYRAWKVTYSQNGTSLGDIMTNTNASSTFTSTWLRIKDGLNLTERVYDYKSAYVSNAKGKDEDFTIFGNTLNIAKIKAYDFDKLFCADLYNVELNGNLFKYRLLLENGESAGADVPMTVEGNKVTLDFSAVNPACRKVDMYMFQDKDDTQLHIYMHTASFVNYFANLKVLTMPLEGNFDLSDAAVEKVFADMEARVESINVSFVFKARK